MGFLIYGSRDLSEALIRSFSLLSGTNTDKAAGLDLINSQGSANGFAS